MTLGRRKGLGVWAVTQRTSRLHKDILEGCEIMLAHRLMGPNDRKAIAGWLADAAQSDVDASQVLAQIGTLAKGEIVAYAPTFGVSPTRFKVRAKRTFGQLRHPLVVHPVSPLTLRELTGENQAWQGRRTEGVPLAHRASEDAARRRFAAVRTNGFAGWATS